MTVLSTTLKTQRQQKKTFSCLSFLRYGEIGGSTKMTYGGSDCRTVDALSSESSWAEETWNGYKIQPFLVVNVFIRNYLNEIEGVL